MLPFPFVVVGENLFEPVCLDRSHCSVYEGGIMKHEELLPATVTPKGAHFPEIWRSLSRLTFLDRYCLHRLTFYRAALSLMKRVMFVSAYRSLAAGESEPVIDVASGLSF